MQTRKRLFSTSFALVLIIFLTGSILPLWSQSGTLSVKITMTATDKAKYLHFMSDKKPADKLNYKSPDLDSASVLDGVLITKALTLGGLDFKLDIIDVPNSERERVTVLAGTAVIGSNSQWDFFFDEHKDEIYRSDLVIPKGSFEKGIYTTKQKAATLSIKTPADLAKLACASSANWRVDWATLKALGFLSLNDSPTRETMFRLVGEGRVDVTVQSFSGNPDMSITDGGYTLYPVQGVKIPLAGARYYMVSKKNPDGKAVYDALQKGLAIMAKDNEINRALTESGFFNQTVKNWTVIDK